LHWNGCGLMLHEFCHLIHNVVLPDGLDNKLVIDVYEQTLSKGKYEKTIRRDWAGRKIDYDKAYALVNRMEFFAEMSVTYFSQSYPELNNKDMEMSKCCPPFLHPKIIEEYHKKFCEQSFKGNSTITKGDLKRLCGKHFLNDNDDDNNLWEAFLKALSNIGGCRNTSQRMPHCNKFYPFTRGQLKEFDPELFDSLTNIWSHILDWEDDCKDDIDCKFLSCKD